MLNKYIRMALVFSVAALGTACDFEEKNIDPNKSTFMEPGPLLTYTQLHTTWDASIKNLQVGTCMMLVQQTATLNNTEQCAGDKYLGMHAPANVYYNEYYSMPIKYWREMEHQAAQNEKYQNMQAVAKIWGAYLFQRVTDLFGNVPYTEAGLGYYEQIYKPKYDTQEFIYKDLVDQVKSGISMLTDKKPKIEGDVFFDGNIDKWKKFGNSILLHLGMRMCKVDPTFAQSTVQAALAGGVMSEAGDICMVKHIAGGRDADKNPLYVRYRSDDNVKNDVVKISDTFMKYLKATNDPRISVLCSLKDGNSDPKVQYGMPNGYDSKSIETVSGFLGKEACSTFNINTILKEDAPTLIMMPSESKLLEAEAVLRGWAQGDATALFNDAVRMAMAEQKVAYGVEIPAEDVEAYIAQDLMGKAQTIDEKMEVLGCQYWIVTFMNGFESYANWRRCGYPKLKPTHYAGNESNGEIPRRLPYSLNEYTINKANVEAAVNQQGTDNVNTRIWWDK